MALLQGNCVIETQWKWWAISVVGALACVASWSALVPQQEPGSNDGPASPAGSSNRERQTLQPSASSSACGSIPIGSIEKAAEQRERSPGTSTAITVRFCPRGDSPGASEMLLFLRNERSGQMVRAGTLNYLRPAAIQISITPGRYALSGFVNGVSEIGPAVIPLYESQSLALQAIVFADPSQAVASRWSNSPTASPAVPTSTRPTAGGPQPASTSSARTTVLRCATWFRTAGNTTTPTARTTATARTTTTPGTTASKDRHVIRRS